MIDPRERSRLLTRASHDLRGPLNAIIGFAGTLLLRLPGPLTPDQEDQVGAIRASAHDLLRFIDRLTELAQLEAGLLRRERGPVDLGVLLAEVARAADVPATVSGGGTVLADARFVRRIVEELVDNAARFGGGARLERLPDAGGRVRVRVADPGPGIAPADRARLFRPLAPLGARATREREGPGLGLYLAARLAAAIDGAVAAEDGPGGAFTLSFPEG
jgi:protein-histidine pros-kinase